MSRWVFDPKHILDWYIDIWGGLQTKKIKISGGVTRSWDFVLLTIIEQGFQAKMSKSDLPRFASSQEAFVFFALISSSIFDFS